MKHIPPLIARWVGVLLCVSLLSACSALLVLQIIPWVRPGATHIEKWLEFALEKPIQAGEAQLTWQGWDLLLELHNLEIAIDGEKHLKAKHARLLCNIPFSLLSRRLYIVWLDIDDLSLPLDTGGAVRHDTGLIVKQARITNSELHFIDTMAGGLPERVVITELLWRHHNRKTDAHARLRPSPDSRETWTVNARSAGTEDIQFRIHSENVDLAAWSPLLMSADADMKLAGRLRNMRIYGHHLRGDISAIGHADSDMALSRPGAAPLAVRAQTSLSMRWNKRAERQTYRLRLQKLNVSGLDWPPLDIGIDRARSGSRVYTAHPSLSATLAAPLLHYWDPSLARGVRLHTGTITRADLLLGTDGSVNRGRLAFSGLHGSLEKPVTRFNALQGDLSWSNDGALDLGLDGGDIELAIPVMPEHLDLRDTQGTVGWKETGPGGGTVSFTPVTAGIGPARLRLEGELEIRDGNVYSTHMLLSGSDIPAALALSHMPAFTPDTLRAGLARTIPQGRITEGRLLMRGIFDDYPFRRNDGVFSIRFSLRDATLHPGGKWPDIDHMVAEVNLSDTDMHSLLSAGNWGNRLRLEGTTLEIKDFYAAEPTLLLNGVVAGSIADIIDLHDFDPGASLPSGEWRLQGQATAEVTARFGPLDSDDAQSTITGALVRMTDNSLTDHDQPLLTLTRMNGDLSFRNGQLQESRLSCRWSGHPAQLTIKNCADTTRLCPLLTGIMDSATLDRWLQNGRLADWPLPDGWLQGQTRFIAGYDKNSALRVESTLEGLNIALPAPLGKSADTIQKLDMVMPAGSWDDLRLDYAGLHVRQTPRPDGVDSLTVTGHIPEMDLDGWWQLATRETLPLPAMPMDIGLTIDSIRLHKRNFEEMEVSLNRSAASGLDLKWNTDGGFSGVVMIPEAIEDTMTVSLSEWRLDLADRNAGKRPGRRWRLNQPVRIHIDRLYLDAVWGGALEAFLEPADDDSAHLRHISLIKPGVLISGQGNEWTTAQGKTNSHVELVWIADRLADIMELFGSMETGISDAPARLSMDLHWAGSLNEFSQAGAGGKMSFTIGSGRMEGADNSQVERLLSLFSLGKVFDRLTLDFSDLANKGKEFDSMAGTMTLSSGVLSTDDMTIVTPTALMRITGDIHIVDREYRQQITVIPKLTSNMTLLAPIFGGLPGLGVGGAAVVLDKITGGLPDQLLSNLVRREYSITGSWDDPQIQPLGTGTQGTPPADANPASPLGAPTAGAPFPTDIP